MTKLTVDGRRPEDRNPNKGVIVEKPSIGLRPGEDDPGSGVFERINPHAKPMFNPLYEFSSEELEQAADVNDIQNINKEKEVAFLTNYMQEMRDAKAKELSDEPIPEEEIVKEPKEDKPRPSPEVTEEINDFYDNIASEHQNWVNDKYSGDAADRIFTGDDEIAFYEPTEAEDGKAQGLLGNYIQAILAQNMGDYG